MGLVEWFKRITHRKTLEELQEELRVVEERIVEMELADAYAERDSLRAELRQLIENQRPRRE